MAIGFTLAFRFPAFPVTNGSRGFLLERAWFRINTKFPPAKCGRWTYQIHCCSEAKPGETRQRVDREFLDTR
jgi:hypothetical protein